MTPRPPRSVQDVVLDGVLKLAPVMVFAYAEDGTCTFSQGSGLSAWGLRPGEMVGRNLWQAYADKPDVVERMRRPLRGESFLATDSVDGRAFDTWYLPLPAERGQPPQALGISIDVTDRVQAQRDLELYRAFVEAAPQFIALARPDGSVMHVNPGGRRLAGVPDDVDVADTTIVDYLTEEGALASRSVEQPAVLRDGRWEGETTLRHWPTGEGIPVRVASFLVTDPTTGEPLALATVQSDLREVVAAREAVQREVASQRGLLVHLHEAQEAERQRIAGEIHDDSVQAMAAVNIRLQALRRSLAPVLPADRLAELDALDVTVRETTARLRRLLLELDPPPAPMDDLPTALKEVADQTVGRHGPRVELDLQVDRDPAPVVARVLLRCAREALTNVAKHAAAATTWVRLREEPGEYVLCVLDDGRGATAADLDAGPLHRGLRTMAERAESVGGTVSVAARDGGGTTVEVRLPHLLGHPGQAPGVPAPRFFLEQVMESIGDGYSALDAQWRYVFMNRAARSLHGLEPADAVVGRPIWEAVDLPAELERAYRRAREDQTPVEVTCPLPPTGRWVRSRVLPAGGGLSVFARDVTAEREADHLADQQREQSALRRGLVDRLTGPADDESALHAAAELLVQGWPLSGLRVASADGALQVVAGEPPGRGAGRRVELYVGGRAVGAAELAGEGDLVDAGVLQLFALRLAARTSTR